MVPQNRALPLAALLFATLVAAPAGAQDVAAAEALFNKGVSEMEAGHFDVACPSLAESQRLDPRPGTMFTLAECEAKAGKIATALVHYEDYLRAAELLPAPQKQRHAQRMDIAKGQKAALAAEVPSLTLVLPADAPADVEISRDGTALSRASLGVALPVDPGEHVITARLATGAVHEQRVSIVRKEKKVVEVAWKAASAGPSATGSAGPGPDGPGVPGSGPSGRRIGAYVAGGAGVVGLALGGVMGGLALGAKGDVDAHCPDLKCDATGQKALDQGRTTSLVSTIGLGVGAAGLVTAAVLWLTEPKAAPQGTGAAGGPSARAGRAPAALGNKGSPVGVVVDVDPSGAVVRLKGAF